LCLLWWKENLMKKLPEGWKWVKLGDVCADLQSGKRPKGGVQGIDSGIPSIGGEHLNSNGGFNFSKIRFVPKDYAEQMKKGLIRKNDIIIVKDGATTGKTSLVDNNFPFDFAVINEHVFIVRLKENVLPRFVFYKLWSAQGNKEILADFRGAAQGGISCSFVEEVQIPLPTLKIQQTIVSKIEQLFGELDKGIESLKTAQQQLKTYRHSVLKWAFEGRLTKVPYVPNVVIKENDNETTIDTIKHNSDNKILPDGWRWVKLENVVKDFVRGPFGSSLKKDFFVPMGYKVYEQQNAIYRSIEPGRYFIDENKFQELKRFEVKPDDYIVCCSGTIGRLFKIPGNSPKGLINQALLIIRINREVISDKFFSLLFTSPFFQRLIVKDAKGTAMLNIAGVKEMKLVTIILPPIEEQHSIVQCIETRLSVADKMEESINQSLQQAEALRQSILKRAFEGKLI